MAKPRLWSEGGYVPAGHHEISDLGYLWAPFIVSAPWLRDPGLVHVHLQRRRRTKRLASEGGPLYRFLLNKWYIDEIYDATVVRGTRNALGDTVLESVAILASSTGLGLMAFAAAAMAGAKRLSRVQSGYLYPLCFCDVVGGCLAILAFVFRSVGG